MSVGDGVCLMTAEFCYRMFWWHAVDTFQIFESLWHFDIRDEEFWVRFVFDTWEAARVLWCFLVLTAVKYLVGVQVRTGEDPNVQLWISSGGEPSVCERVCAGTDNGGHMYVYI